MAPWANRAPAGPQVLAGRPLDLLPNFVDGTAIHGLVHSAPWETLADGGLGIRAGGDGDGSWPWAFEVTLDASVEDGTLALDYRLTNRSEAPMPAGLGLHPWFRRPLEVRLCAERVYEANVGSSHDPVPVTGPFDLRALAEPAAGLDGTWVGLADGSIDLAWPLDGVSARLVMRPRMGHPLVALASPSSIDAVAVEPQTHGPDPMRRLESGEPDAPLLLPGGGELRLGLALTVSRARDLQ
jgi:aldose 1-epimerase